MTTYRSLRAFEAEVLDEDTAAAWGIPDWDPTQRDLVAVRVVGASIVSTILPLADFETRYAPVPE